MPSDHPTDPTGATDPTQRLDATDSIDSGDVPRRPATLARRGVTALLAAAALLVAGVLGAGLAGGNGSGGLAVSAGSTASPTADAEDEDESEREGRLRRFKNWAEEHRGGVLRGGGPGHAFGFGLGFMGGALHGSYVVPDPDGGYQTMVTQRGEATAVSATSLTVKSEDGFTTTYRLTDDTVLHGSTDGVDAIEEGDQVSVSGVKADGVTRGLHVADLSQLEELRLELPDRPVPSPSSTTEGTSADV